MVNYWWVNQNQTYTHEVRGGYLWSPKVNANGARNQFYENMMRIEPGDVVFSFCDTYIKAIGVCISHAESVPKPTAFGTAGAYWNDEGWFVEMQFRELVSPIRPREHMALLEPTLPQTYSPLQRSGDGNQGVYLAELPIAMAYQLLSLLVEEGQEIIAALEVFVNDTIADLAAEAAIQGRNDIGATEKIQLVKARRGQGLFKSRVELIEDRCRVTKVRRPEHLVASHIKPWRSSTDEEKLDGHNGLLLAPHIDHLFDRGSISFTDEGKILVAATLAPEVLARWSIDQSQTVGSFSHLQCRYLEYHRDIVFRSH
jgi:putative restriction endonuclease